MGGTEDGEIGTSIPMVQAAIEDLKETQHIFIFTDIGSSTMSSEMAVEMIEDEALASKVSILDKPIVEGAFEAAVKASVGQPVEEIEK